MFTDIILFSDKKSFQTHSFEVRDVVKKPIGIVRRKIEEEGKVILFSEEKNTIVNLARASMAHAISEATGVASISHFKLGTGGHVVGDILTSLPALESDLDLEIPEYSQPVVTKVFTLNDTTVTFQITIEKSDANVGAAYAYNEAGLFTNSGTILFSRDTFPAMIKTPARKFYFEWAIVF